MTMQVCRQSLVPKETEFHVEIMPDRKVKPCE